LCCASGSLAGLTISVSPSGQSPNVSVQTVSANRFTVTVSPTATITSLSITGDGGDSIDWIEVTTEQDVTFSSITGIVDLGRLERTSSSGRIRITNLIATGNLGSDSEPIHAHDINTVTVDGGSILGDIINPGSPNAGDWGIIETTSPTGNLRGDIINGYGGIGSILVGGDIFADPGDRLLIRAGPGKDIKNIVSTNMVRASVAPTTGPVDESTSPAPTFSVQQVIARESVTDSRFSITSLGSFLDVEDDMIGSALRVSSPLLGNPSEFIIRVGELFASDSKVILPAEGLGAPMELGGDLPDLSWEGEVIFGGVGGSELAVGTVPEYAASAASIGGGAVGRAPFRVHGTDSLLKFRAADAPRAESFINEVLAVATNAIDATFEFSLQFYGRVTGRSSFGSFDHLILERRVQGSTSSADWRAYNSGCVSCYLPVGSLAPSGRDNNRWARMTAAASPPSPIVFANGYEYRIIADTRLLLPNDEPNDSVLLCDLGLLGFEAETLPVSDDDGIYFKVGNSCPADLNGDGIVNGGDLSILLSNFGNSGVCGIGGDANNDFQCNGADLSLILSLFGGFCVQAEGLRGSENGGSGPDIIGLLGFNSASAYSAWVDGLSEQELTAHIADLLSIIAELEQSEQ